MGANREHEAIEQLSRALTEVGLEPAVRANADVAEDVCHGCEKLISEAGFL